MHKETAYRKTKDKEIIPFSSDKMIRDFYVAIGESLPYIKLREI